MITKAGAVLFTLLVIATSYATFGWATTLVVASGFLIGLVLWLIFPAAPPYQRIRAPYWIALALFIVHRIEERFSGFFDALASVTGVATPDIVSVPVILLVVVSVGAWLLVPLLAGRGYAFGYYLAWTFFASLGITELAHIIVFPSLVGRPFAYFPGAASVFLLAPVAWWGMWRLARRS